MIELVLGGARSGKSRYAEQQALAMEKPVIYVATAHAGDDEMRARIARHRADRPDDWQTLEEPVRLGEMVTRHATTGNCLLVDCLTLWLNNVLFDPHGELQTTVFEAQKASLLKALADCPGNVILVSNEVGLGVVAVERSTRRFVDEAGWLHQDIAHLSNRVVFVTAGIARKLK